MSDSPGLIEATRNLFGGAGLTLISAFLGRAMWHVSEVRKQNRELFGKEIVWELPLTLGMAFVAEGAASYLDFGDRSTVMLIAVLAYFGPRGIEAIFTRWVFSRFNK